MKQVIRENCFETNSSSEHTITICNINEYKYKEIPKGQNLIIFPYDHDKKGYSYTYTSRGNYEKAQLLLSTLGYEIEKQLYDVVPYDENRDYDDIRKERRQNFYNVPIVVAYVNALKRYIGEEYTVDILFTSDNVPFIDYVSFEETTESILGIEKKDLTDIEKLTDLFYKIIFDNEMQIVDSYHDS